MDAVTEASTIRTSIRFPSCERACRTAQIPQPARRNLLKSLCSKHCHRDEHKCRAPAPHRQPSRAPLRPSHR